MTRSKEFIKELREQMEPKDHKQESSPSGGNTVIVTIDNDNKTIVCGDLEVGYSGESKAKNFTDSDKGEELCQILADTTVDFKFIHTHNNTISVYRDYTVNAITAFPIFTIGTLSFSVEEI